MFRPRTLCQMKPAPEEINTNLHKSSLPDGYLKNPTYKGDVKEYPSKTKKPIQLTTKAYLVQKIDRKGIEDIPAKEQMIDFNKFLLQFKSAEEVQELEVVDLLDIDAELLESLKKNVETLRMLHHICRRKRRGRGRLRTPRVTSNLCNI